LFFIWIELGPTVISDAGLITCVGFAALPKFYTNNLSIIQKLIYNWFPIPILYANFTISQCSLQSSLQNREIWSHPFPHRSRCRCLHTADTKTITLEPNTCVNLEVLKSTTNSNTNIYHPNTTIGDDVCLLRVSFSSTLESLPLQLCSQPLTSNSFVIVCLWNLPGHSCALDLIPSFFLSKGTDAYRSSSLQVSSFFSSRSRSSYMVPSSDTIKRVTFFLLL
jgi:hypothetical protein